MRRLLPAICALACLAFAAGALAARSSSERDGAPRATALRSSGSLTLADSRAGLAIFSAPNLGPGRAASGDVTIANSGTLPGALRLAAVDLQDVPGAGGGLLSQRMQLMLRDVSGTPFTVYNGSLAGMAPLALGVLGPGQARHFRFFAWLPHGSADNVFEGSSMSVGYRWTATETKLPAPRPPRPPWQPDHRPPQCSLFVPRGQNPLRRRRLVVKIGCNERTQVTVWGWATTRRGTRRFFYGARRKAVAARHTLRLSLRLPAAPRRILRSSRRPTVRVVATARDGAGNRGDLNVRARIPRR